MGVGIALVLAQQPEEPRPLLKRVAARLVLAQVLGDGLDLGDEQQLELAAGGEVVERVRVRAGDFGRHGGGVADAGDDVVQAVRVACAALGAVRLVGGFLLVAFAVGFA